MKALLGRLSRRNKIIIGSAAAAVLILIVLISARGQGDAAGAYQTVRVERGTLTATVGATGTVHARQSATLLWQVGGTVEAVHVGVGDRVQREDVLAVIEQTTLPQSVISAEADLVAARQELDDLLNSDTARAQAQIDLRAAQEDFDRAEEYRESLNGLIDLKRVTFSYIGGHEIPHIKYYKGYADAETIAKADEDLALKKAQLDDAQRAYDRIKDGPNQADVTAAEARVAAAQATLNTGRIIAPFSGVITQAEALPGDQVAAGDVAFRVDDLARLLVDVEISEVDINSVTAGQSVTLTFDAILGRQPYDGTVVEVAQAGNAVDGVVNFTVTVEINNADELVKPGMTAAVTITVQEIEDVILIPNRAVRVVDGKRVVYVLRDGQPEMVEIRLGPSSETMSVLVSDDVEEGDLIILNPPVQFQPGGGPGGGGPF